ncbi:HAD-IIIA family hydrolase [Patescibacteria group bacterium]|nr:HAD-IIIA family hydrolase [Patescibacteria group bacterium]
MAYNVKRRAIFFDRDGVINELVYRGENFVVADQKVQRTAPWVLQELRIYDGAAAVIQQVREKGYMAIIATNQPDMRHGLMEQAALFAIMNAVCALGFDDAFMCTHTRAEGCLCHKPLPGMLHQAEKKWNLDMSDSFMLGDMETDLQAARAAGCTPVLIDRPYNINVPAEHRINTHAELLRLIN